MPAAISPVHDEWINGTAARLLLDCTVTALQRACIMGQIRVKLVPGVPPLYNRADVESYAQQIPSKAERRRHYARPRRRSGA